MSDFTPKRLHRRLDFNVLSCRLPAVITVFVCMVVASCSGDVLRIGAVTDVHYSNIKPDSKGRLYSASAAKLREAAKDLHATGVDMVVSLGDLIDGDMDSYDELSPILDSIGVPVHKVLGNHDYLDISGSATFEKVKDKLKVSEKPFSVRYKSYRLYFLNSNSVSIQACGEDCPQAEHYRRILGKEFRDWNGAMGGRQLKWLDRRLFFSDILGEKAVCFAHMPIVPEGIKFSQWDAGRTAEVLIRHKCVKAYICGHHHAGGFSLIGDRIPHIMLQGMIEGSDNHYSVITFTRDSILVSGKGVQPSGSFLSI